MKKLMLLVIALLLFACKNETLNQEEIIYKLNDRIKPYYNKSKDLAGFIGMHGARTCDEEANSILDSISKISNLNDILYMLDDSSSNAFKIYLLYQLMSKDSILGKSKIIEFSNDTIMIKRNTSCFGFPFKRSMKDECKLISGDYYYDLFKDEIIKY